MRGGQNIQTFINFRKEQTYINFEKGGETYINFEVRIDFQISKCCGKMLWGDKEWQN